MAAPSDVLIGIIGGSGVYKMDFVDAANPTSYKIDTPFGAPSDDILVAEVDGVKCAFLPRHGRAHTFTPTEVNYRANIFAMKVLGVRYLLSVTAVGSLREHLQPGDLVVVDQLIDRTSGRKQTFFGNGIVAHVAFSHPMCPNLSKLVVKAVATALPNVKVHEGATLVTMEGPAFSTQAESLMNRQLSGDLIGMTTATESKLCREAEIAHCCVAMVTDMDSWTGDNHVDVAKVMHTLHQNSNNAQIYTKAVIEAIGRTKPDSEAHDALKVAIMTHKAHIPEAVRLSLQPLIGKYVS